MTTATRGINPISVGVGKEELAKRNAAVKEGKDAATDAAAVIFMCNWMKRKGVPKEKILDLANWSDAERQHIIRIYRYSY